MIQLAVSCRPYQWVKNLLVFVPLLLSHRWGDPTRVRASLLGFAAFSAASSAVYLFNDLLDRQADRVHPFKKNRPLASGVLSPAAAIAGLSVLSALAIWLASREGGMAVFTLLLYLAAGAAYSIGIKCLPVIDVIFLAGFYTFRIFFGGVMSGIAISHWTLSFSMFMFLSLAFMKRYSELHVALKTEGPPAASRRGYAPADLTILGAMAAGSGLVGAMVAGLYLQTPDVRALYRRPDLIWLVMPVLLAWICRHLLLAGRGEIREDPVLFAVKDAWSLALGVAAAVIWALAI